jgi:hypothetical protein
MAKDEHVDILRQGVSKWNAWRDKEPSVYPDLSGLDFYDVFLGNDNLYDIPAVYGANFDNCNLRNAKMRDREFDRCTFRNAQLHMTDCCYAYFSDCNFTNTQMRLARIGSTSFSSCHFESCDFSYSSAEDTRFLDCKIENSLFKKVHFVKADFSESSISKCNVYGISSWDMILENTIQEDIYIMEDEDELLSVDDIELAQFLYKMIENKNLRRIIDTITSSVVLILGRFTKERKEVLDRIKHLTRENGFIPVLFDFDGPESRDITETVKILASISKLVIADISDPRSIPQELMLIIPTSPSLVIYPIIEENQREYGMFSFFEKYNSVKEISKYNFKNIDSIVTEIFKSQ